MKRAPIRLGFAVAFGLLAIPGSVALAHGGGGHGAGDGECEGHRPMGRGGMHRHRHHLKRALKELDLSDSQRQQVRAIFESAHEQMAELRSEGPPTERGELFRRVMRETYRLVLDVLTPEQREKLEARREEHMRTRRERKLERMRTRLGLTPAQEGRVRAILEQSAQRRRAAMEREVASLDDMKSVHDETRAAVREVLTAQQREVFDQMPRRHRRERRAFRERRAAD